ncbi:MAG: BlaI/MecI/CopY family transcriptional regulator [Prevotella sp.]|nr:BlaI/MecI/CopY family transcriptional regulator [Prevotella sp.]
MKEKSQLTKAETQVMNVLWSLPTEQGVTSAEVMERYAEPKPAMTTLLTFLKRLTEKGIVRTEKHGKLLYFTPLLTREEYTQQMMTDMKDTFFGGSLHSLISFFVRHEPLDSKEIDELVDIIRQKKTLNNQ